MQTAKRHIALVTTWFPPRNGVAVNRMLAFVKYMDHSEFDISVITLKEKNEADMEDLAGATVYRETNHSFLSTIPTKAGESRIIHTMKVLWNVFINKVYPFEYATWKQAAAKRLAEVNSRKKVDILISSYSPVEAHLVALEFCEHHPGTRWLADMRDEMSMNPHLPSGAKHRLFETEKKINDYAVAVTSVSEPILSGFKRLMPGIKFFEEIRNGFDHELLPKNNFNEIFTIAYAGTFYGARKPHTFFKGLEDFMSKTNLQIKLQFIGTNRNFEIPGEFESQCEFLPRVTNMEALELISRADANLLILPPVDGKGVFTGKIFDYLSVMKPVIAVVDPDDVAAKLILECRAGFVADFNDRAQICIAIGSAYELWKTKKPVMADKQKISTLHRKYQVAKLQSLIHQILQA